MRIRQTLALRIDCIRSPHERQWLAGKRREKEPGCRSRPSGLLRVSEPRGTTSDTCCAARIIEGRGHAVPMPVAIDEADAFSCRPAQADVIPVKRMPLIMNMPL